MGLFCFCFFPIIRLILKDFLDGIWSLIFFKKNKLSGLKTIKAFSGFIEIVFGQRETRDSQRPKKRELKFVFDQISQSNQSIDSNQFSVIFYTIPVKQSNQS